MKLRDVILFCCVLPQIEQFRTPGIQLVNIFPAAVAEPHQTKRIVGIEKSHPLLPFKRRPSLMISERRQAQHLENGRRGVDETDRSRNSYFLMDQPRHCDQVRNSDVLLVEKE